MKPTLLFGARWGVRVGVILAALLLLNGALYGWEALEGSAMIAWMLGVPVSVAFAALGFGDYASQWVAFISLVLPLNGALLGMLIAVVIRGLRRASA